MAQLVVRNLAGEVKERLKRRAQRHGRSMEEEARRILSDALKSERVARGGLGSRIARRFAGWGLKEDLPELRGYPARPASFRK